MASSELRFSWVADRRPAPVVQSAGMGYRLKASQMMEEFNRSGPVLNLLLRYTQALITQMAQTALGVRREGVTEAAGRLHAAGFITYRRGHITVLDRAQLERRSIRPCHCCLVPR
jgi:hypothetical protein